MIQRIQTIWLLLAAICAFLTIRFSIYSGTDINNVPYEKLTAATGGFLILAITILIGVIAGVAIFMFKNRSTQLWLCAAGLLAEFLLIFLYYRKITSFAQGTLSLTAMLHIGIILLFILAFRGIYKDEKLVKESDRLR